MKWILASDRLGDFTDSDIPHWKFFNCDFAKVDGKPVERPLFRKDIESGKIVFSYKGVFGSNELPESEFHRIVWLDEQDEGWVPVAVEELKKEIIMNLWSNDQIKNEPYLYTNGKAYSRQELGEEIARDTATGRKVVNNMLMLALDLMARKAQPPATKD